MKPIASGFPRSRGLLQASSRRHSVAPQFSERESAMRAAHPVDAGVRAFPRVQHRQSVNDNQSFKPLANEGYGGSVLT